jgi:hypothetical protein
MLRTISSDWKNQPHAPAVSEDDNDSASDSTHQAQRLEDQNSDGVASGRNDCKGGSSSLKGIAANGRTY